jgi:hypothetical protein
MSRISTCIAVPGPGPSRAGIRWRSAWLGSVTSVCLAKQNKIMAFLLRYRVLYNRQASPTPCKQSWGSRFSECGSKLSIRTTNKIRFIIPKNETVRHRSQFPPILLQPNRWSDRWNILIAHRFMNVGIENEAAQFHFREYSFPVFGTVSLQCGPVAFI